MKSRLLERSFQGNFSTPIQCRFFAWLCRAKIIPANPAADLDLPRKQARQLPKSISAEEMRRMLPVGERAAAWLDRHAHESRPCFDHLPGETAMFLSGYGIRITPDYLGNWIKQLMKRCGIDKPGSCHFFRPLSPATPISPPSGPTHWLFQGPPAESKLLLKPHARTTSPA